MPMEARIPDDDCLRARFREKIHIVEAGDAALDHFGARELSAV